MSVACPQCQTPLNAAASETEEVVCSSCGASFRLAGGATAAWKPADIQRRLGKFELLDLVGAGAFGSVYKARDAELGRIVAVKVPRAGNLGSSCDSDRFLREARSVAQLRHPSIVPVFEIGQDSGLPFLVSEFVHGITLADLLTAERLPPRAAAELAADIADALDYAHQQGVIHRDIKPSNIMLETAGKDAAPAGRYVPRLMDFGLAKRDAGEATMTVEGQVLGTPAYMSPEQARGESHAVDGRGDVYSLGVVLYQLLTGELPFKGNARMLLHQVLHDEPRPPRQRDPKVPRDLETVCLKAMAKDPARRYQTAGELAADLRRFLAGEPIRARPVSFAERLWRGVRRNPAVYGLAAAVVVLLAVVIGFLVARPKEAPTAIPAAPVIPAYPEPDQSADDLLKAVAELDRTDPGWRLDEMEAKRPVIPDGKNGAAQIGRFRKAIADMIGRPRSEGSWCPPELYDRVYSLPQLPPNAPLNAADVESYRAELKRVESPLALARQMIDYPQGRFTVAQTRDVISTLLPEHQTGRNVAILLYLDAVIQLADGNRGQAVNDCRAMWNVGRAYLDEPIEITQVIRIAVIRMALHVMERILAHGECTDADLAAFQQLIEQASQVPVYATMMRANRGMLHYFLSSLATGDVPKDTQALKVMGIEDRSLLPDAKDLRRIHAWMLPYETEEVEIAGRPPEEWAALLKPHEEKAKAAPLAGAPLVEALTSNHGLFNPSRGRSMASGMAAVATLHIADLRSALTALAVERYRMAHGDWPPDLAALVPAYLKDVPTDPYDGQPIRYRRTADGVAVYSVGPDGTDNQGHLHQKGDPDGSDVGFQLWDAAKRRPPAGSEPPS